MVVDVDWSGSDREGVAGKLLPRGCHKRVGSRVGLVPDPYTQSMNLIWRPELRFYERRVSILESFEAEGMLRAFRVQENFINARLFDSRDLLTLRQNGLELQLETPDSDPERAWVAVEMALSSLQPTQPRLLGATFQHVAPLDVPFDVAIGHSFGRILGAFGAAGIKFVDWALLVDMEKSEEWSGSGQIEFGIVRAKEVPDRLARRAGRTGDARDVADAWTVDRFAEVSIFSDCTLGALADPSEDLASQAGRFWARARKETGTVVQRIQELISDADRPGVSTHE